MVSHLVAGMGLGCGRGRAQAWRAWGRGLGLVLPAVFCLLGAAPLPLHDSVATLDGLSAFTQGAFAEAYRSWLQAARQGDANGALYLGVMYDTGQGIAPNPVAALGWYREAARLGSAAGAFNVGVMYDAGRAGAADPAEAARWYRQAAAMGYARADYNLALLYEDGIGVRQDRAAAARLFQAAARLGLTAALGHGAVLPRAAGKPRQGGEPPLDAFARAQAVLLARTPGQAGEVAALFRSAADRRNALAEYDLAYCYENGIGVARNDAAAYRWYGRARDDAADAQLRGMAVGGLAATRRNSAAGGQ